MDRRDLLKLLALSPLAPAAAKAATEQPEHVSWTWEAGGRSATVHVPRLKAGEVLLVGGVEAYDPEPPILDASYMPAGHVLLRPRGIEFYSYPLRLARRNVITYGGREFDLFDWLPASGGRYVTVVLPMEEVVNQR